MKALENRLTKELQHDRQIKIMHTQIWNLPIQSLQIEYETVKQTKMDILMKMLLLTFQESEFKSIESLSEVLLVEPLFIQHIVQKMLHAGLITKQEEFFSLSAKGIEQLETEIFIDKPENCTDKLIYSPCHERFLTGEVPDNTDDQLDEYRFYDDYSSWDVSSIDDEEIMTSLNNQMEQAEKTNEQIVISEIHSVAPLTIEFLACIEFQLYHTENDVFYARVWNTQLEEWDEVLEEQINMKDRAAWREQYYKQ